MHHLVYLHGFLSSPASNKAQQTVKFAKQHYPSLNIHVLQLPGNINKAVAKIDHLLATLAPDQVGFIGSSMGGFLATYALEKYAKTTHCKAVLVNPAIEPFNLLEGYRGKHLNPYTNEIFYVTNEHIEKLKSINTHSLRFPKCYKVLLQTGDETLDYRLAVAKYAQSQLLVEQGGDHSFVGYQTHLPSIFRFLFS